MPTPGLRCNSTCFKRRQRKRPHVVRSPDSTAPDDRSSAAPAGTTDRAALVSLVSQAVSVNLHPLLHGAWRLPAAFPLDRLLGPQLLLRAGAGVAQHLGQLLRSR